MRGTILSNKIKNSKSIENTGYGSGNLSVLKGSSDPSHFIFEINVGKRRIRHKTTLNLK